MEVVQAQAESSYTAFQEVVGNFVLRVKGNSRLKVYNWRKINLQLQLKSIYGFKQKCFPGYDGLRISGWLRLNRVTKEIIT